MISVAMATYNGEKFLREQLDSILNQTYKDIELIVCDDCSTDSTWSILQEYQQKDKRIRCYKNEKNLGFKKNFGKAISLCNGEFIALSDQDDIWIPEKLEESIKYINEYDMTCSNASLIDKNNLPLNLTMQKDILRFDFFPTNQDQLLCHLCHKNIVQGATILAKTNFIKECLPIPDVFPFHDHWFALFAATHNGIKYIDKPLLLYRKHTNQQTINDKKNILDELKPTNTKTDLHHFYQQHQKELEAFLRVNLNTAQARIIQDAITYYKHILKKDKYYITYFIKNYDIITLRRNKIEKILIISRKIIGLVRKVSKDKTN